MNDKWFLRPLPHVQASLRLFCFHPAGRGASTYVSWGSLLPKDMDLCCIQLPGRESRMREAPFTRIAPLIDSLEEAIFPLLDRPFAIFGASMGAIVAFELAHKLRETYNLLPAHLFLASRRAPQAPERLPMISHLPKDQFLQEVQRRYNSIPDVIRNDAELMELFLPLLRADFSVIETYPYRQEAPFDCPLTVLRGTGDQIVLEEDMQGWESHTSRRFTRKTYEGSHFFFNDLSKQVVNDIVIQLTTIH